MTVRPQVAQRQETVKQLEGLPHDVLRGMLRDVQAQLQEERRAFSQERKEFEHVQLRLAKLKRDLESAQRQREQQRRHASKDAEAAARTSRLLRAARRRGQEYEEAIARALDDIHQLRRGSRDRAASPTSMPVISVGMDALSINSSRPRHADVPPELAHRVARVERENRMLRSSIDILSRGDASSVKLYYELDPREEPVGIPELFVQYLKAKDFREQLAIVHAHPALFTDDVVAALKDARAQINETFVEVKEAFRIIDAVSGSLQYTGTSVQLQQSEVKEVLNEEAILKNFAASLAGLLRAGETAGPAAPSTISSLSTACRVSSSLGAGQSQSPGAWFTQPSLVFSVLAFLPAEEIFMAAENVCRAWQTWLFLPDMSRFFWVGCVQREFPEQLQVALQTAGDDLYESDWRSLAMLCVTEAEQAAEAEEAEEVGTEGLLRGVVPFL
ncbi:hypothetical protein CGC21_27125 [Leishmania donovani]|uniref:Uncharacterized protein n=1 Tax=Leishmania donovani TaxID=5661 RepID=A0A504WUH3_LEIDO|nr:hypothetical protein CGC21_27125 [Leishmania donovani]